MMREIKDIDQLEELLSQPSDGAIGAMKRLTGDIMLLGAGGKMGPTLARMARRASDAAGVQRRVIAVSRFSDGAVEIRLRDHGVEIIRCDLSDSIQIDHLPDVPNIIFMVGMKFGSTGNEAATWVTNVLTPAFACRKFADSRIVAFSTGNVYGLTPVAGGGSLETDPLRPVGEYAMSALGRERILEHFSRTQGTAMTIVRLNYANELRYGVLVDLARAVWHEKPIDVEMGAFNVIWQGDANSMALCAFDHTASPPRVLNVTGPEVLSVRNVAETFGRRLGKRVILHGAEASDALVSNSQQAQRLFGQPQISAEQMIESIADWVRRGGESLAKPTHFQVRDGVF